MAGDILTNPFGAQMELIMLVSSLMVVLSPVLIFVVFAHEKYNKPKSSLRATRITELICLIVFVVCSVSFAMGIDFIKHQPFTLTGNSAIDSFVLSIFAYNGYVLSALTVFAFVSLAAPVRLRRLIMWMYILYPFLAAFATYYELHVFKITMSVWLGGVSPMYIASWALVPMVVYLIITRRR